MWVLFVFLFSIFKTLDAVSEFWFDAHWSVFTNEWILLYIFFYDEAVWYCNLKHPVFLHKNTIAHYEFWFTSLTFIKWKLKHSLYYFLNIDTDEYSLWLLIRSSSSTKSLNDASTLHIDTPCICTNNDSDKWILIK